MKAKRVDNRNDFEPVTIELTFETLPELEQFWHRMNFGSSMMSLVVNDGYHTTAPTGKIACDESGYIDFAEIWHVVEDILQELVNK